MLDTFADTLNLTERCDEYLRTSIPAELAYEILKIFTESDDELENVDDPTSIVTATAIRLFSGKQLACEGRISRLVLNRSSSREEIEGLIRLASVVQVMQLVDDFCDKFGIQTLGEKELKFALPMDSVVMLIYDLSCDTALRDSVAKEFIIVSRCRRIRLQRGIDIASDPVMSLVPVDRTALTVTGRATPSPVANTVTTHRFQEAFPLNMKSVLKHSGPDIVLVLSLSAVEGVVYRWLNANASGDRNQFMNQFPFDSVVRAIKASPTCASHATWLVKQSCKTKNRFRYPSIGELKKKIEKVVHDHSLSREISETLHSRLSITYSYMIVFGKINRKDSIPLHKGGSQITLNAMRKLMQLHPVPAVDPTDTREDMEPSQQCAPPVEGAADQQESVDLLHLEDPKSAEVQPEIEDGFWEYMDI